MNTPKFPHRNPDGSFCVEVGLELKSDSPGELVASIQSWFCDVWMVKNSTWVRTWETGPNLESKKNEVLKYEDEFLSVPRVELGRQSELCISLSGAKLAKLWKDWLVSKIAPDLKTQFPQVGDLLYIRNMPEQQRRPPSSE